MTIPSDSEPVLVDSSGWLEYLTEDSKAELFAPYMERQQPILVPTVVLYEVYKKLLVAAGKTSAERFASQALRCPVIPLDEGIALAAARLSVDHGLPMADAVIYSSSQAFQAQLITSDPHFKDLAGVTLL